MANGLGLKQECAVSGEADFRKHAPATLRNREAILAVLRGRLAPGGLVLEVASGSGEHAAYFATGLPGMVFQPSDPHPESRASIDAWAASARLANLRPALALDATAPDWKLAGVDAVLCINMLHIAPWAAARGLIRNSARVLGRDGLLFLYGPFKRGGAHTAPSNAVFDLDLLGRDPEWGVRDLEAVAAEAEGAGFGVPEILAMPANNLSVVFRLEGSLGAAQTRQGPSPWTSSF